MKKTRKRLDAMHPESTLVRTTKHAHARTVVKTKRQNFKAEDLDTVSSAEALESSNGYYIDSELMTINGKPYVIPSAHGKKIISVNLSPQGSKCSCGGPMRLDRQYAIDYLGGYRRLRRFINPKAKLRFSCVICSNEAWIELGNIISLEQAVI